MPSTHLPLDPQEWPAQLSLLRHVLIAEKDQGGVRLIWLELACDRQATSHSSLTESLFLEVPISEIRSSILSEQIPSSSLAETRTSSATSPSSELDSSPFHCFALATSAVPGCSKANIGAVTGRRNWEYACNHHRNRKMLSTSGKTMTGTDAATQKISENLSKKR